MKPKVVIIDNDQLVLTAAVQLFEESGIHVRTHCDPEVALAEITEHPTSTKWPWSTTTREFLASLPFKAPSGEAVTC